MPGLIPESATIKGPQGVPRDDLQAWPRLPLRLWQGGWWTLSSLVRRKPLGAASALILCGLVVVAILAPVLAPYDPYTFNLNACGLPIRLHPPNATFLCGTDPLGRDVLSRMVYGSRVSLIVGFASVAIGTLLGTLLGLVSGYWEGGVDEVLQRAVDIVMALPGIVLALA